MKRKQAIKKMYDYEGTIPKAMILPKTGEVIHNWYIIKFPDITDLEKKVITFCIFTIKILMQEYL